MIARVATEIALNRLFDYEVPVEMISVISVGSRVKIPFGHRLVLGYVTELIESSFVPNLKKIESVIGEQNLITPQVVKLASWMASYYCCTIEVALRSLLPQAVRREQDGWKRQLFVRYNSDVEPSKKLTARQKEVLEFVQKANELPLTELTELAHCTAALVRNLEGTGKVTVAPLRVLRDPYANVKIIPTRPLTLNSDQSAAMEAILKGMDAPKGETVKPFLLFGVTGSGKTEIYLQTIAHALERGQGAIVLVPEISLTPQTVERFKSRFAEGPLRTQVAVLHSHLSSGERHDEWHKIRRGDAKIVIGARSAIFAPVEPLGVIIVDEEHENSYKQEEAPRYNARDVAVVRGQMENTVIILGSATPSMESFYNTTNGKYTLLKLPHRVDNIQMPQVFVVDMSREFRVDKGIPFFSTALKEAIRLRLELHQQVILFLNRRGYATHLQCPACGYTATCPNCSVSLVFHRRQKLLRCHICGYNAPAPIDCPECRKPGIVYTGYGTERIEETLQKLYPKASICRMDSDTLQRKEDYRYILDDFGAGKIDILLGTQMITKGLHFPRVTLVGIINADGSLHRPDFRASERTFQLITQVAGRAGRGTEEGEVIVQCFTPWAPAVFFARKHDFEGFYEEEIKARADAGYPPFNRLALLTIKGQNRESVIFVSENLRKELNNVLEGISVIKINGPVPALLERAEGFYRFHILIRTLQMPRLSHKLFELYQSFKCPEGISYTVDIDPSDLI